MGIVLCLLAGGIAANMVAWFLPQRSIHGILNIAFGLLAGGFAYSLVADFAAYPPSLGALILMMGTGGVFGAATTLLLGGLRNAVFGQPLQS